MIPNFVSGWYYDAPRIAEVIQARSERGDAVYASAYSATMKEPLKGAWQRAKDAGIKGIFLRDVEPEVNGGQHRRPYLQRAGTCISRGVDRGCQTSLDYAIVKRFKPMRPVTLTFAPIYSLARHEVGKDRCGGGDGAILADAAQAVHDYGVATTDLFPGTSEDDVEKIAVKFAAPGVGTPSSWIAECKGHNAVTFAPDNADLLFDCIAAGYAVPYAMNYVTGSPNSAGLSDLGSYGPHCRCFVGVYLDEHGETQLESSESWGRFPAGQPTDADQTMPVDQIPCVAIRYAGGLKKLAPGNVGVSAKRFLTEVFSEGEAWAVGAPNYTVDSVGEMFANKVPEMGAA